MDKTGDRLNTLFTIGYADLRIDRFIHLLNRHSIEAIADVRSSPFSRYYHEFNSENIRNTLKINGIKYVFLGKELGAQRIEEECYVNGKVSYDLVFETEAFQDGVSRLLNGLSKMSIALLCAEKDPIYCHRAILICRYVQSHPVHIKHILNSGKIEDHYDLEIRLLKVLSLNNMELFRSQRDIIDEAYRKQAQKIAFSKEEIIAKERKYVSG